MIIRSSLDVYRGCRYRVSIDFPPDDPDSRSLTKQSFKDECDINNILRRYDRDGLLTHVQNTAPTFGVFVDTPTYQDALNAVIAAQDAFAGLPSSIRKRFDNDPQAYVDFCSDPANYDEAVALGLAQSKAERSPILVRIAPESD